VLPAQNIPEDFFYRLLPQGVINLDTRKLIEAVMGGYQDRISDLRSYASKLNELVVPDAELPQLGFNVVLVTFEGPVGQIITRSLDILPSTPDLDDTAALKQWATNELQLDDSSKIRSAIAGTDVLRLIDVDSISLLAGNVGAILYPGLHDDESADVARRTRQQLLQSHFPRLRIKGTADSFELLGRVLGFDAVAMTPLWSRLVPRLPNDPGNAENAEDFNARPEQTPSAVLPDQRYNPIDFKDGEFFTYNSGPLSEDPDSADFWPIAVNNRNPFLKLIQLGVVERPAIGRYVLDGGKSNVVPSVLLDSGTVVSNLRAEGLAAGSSMNGLKLNVIDFSGTAVGLEVTAKLSAVKYRSSYFDLKATIRSVGTEPVQSSSDLESDPSLTPDGTAVVPFRPWVGGSAAQDIEVYPTVDVGSSSLVLPRTQATGNQVQMSRGEFDEALSISNNLDSMKAATRRIRTRSVGLSVRDDANFAAYPSEALLFVTNGVGTYSGFANSKAPRDPKRVQFQAIVGDFNATTFVDLVSDGTVAITGGDFYGIYRLTDDYYSIAVFAGPFSSGGRMTANFTALQGTNIRSEPSFRSKMDGTVAYSHNPEDQVNFSGSNVSFYDEMPWRRENLIAGQQVDDDFYNPASPDLDYKQAVVPYRVLALSGRQYEVAVLDGVQKFQPFRFKIIQNLELDPITGDAVAANYDRMLLAEDDSGDQYHVLLIDKAVVSSQYWSPAKRSNIVQWVPFNEHPLDDVEPYARYASSVDAEINHANRLWDAGRGWYLKLVGGNEVAINSPTGLGTEFSFAFWLNPASSPTTGSAYAKILDVGGFLSLEITNNASVSSTFIRLKAMRSGVLSDIATFALDSDWQYIAVRRSDTSFSFGLGTEAASITWQNFTISDLDEVTSSRLVFTCGLRAYGIHDFTAWNARKSDADFELVRNPRLVKSSVAYPSTWVESLSRDNRYIFELVDSGFAYPAKSDLRQERDTPAYAQRYDGFGLYRGDPRYKLVGLGDGNPVQPAYPLGFRGPYVEGAGRTLIAGSFTPLPGYTEAWGTVPGKIVRVSAPFNSNGGTTTTPTTISSPWPNNVLGNPAQDRAYVKGDDGYVYKIYADDAGSGPVLKAERTTFEKSQPTDAHSVLGAVGKRLSVSVSGTTFQVYQANDAGQTWNTPPLYLYRQSRVYVDAITSGAYSRWSNPNSFGQGLSTAALNADGELQFANSESLPIGTFQLTFDVGNIGTVDDNFAGFSTIVSLISGSGSVVAQESQVLLVDGEGANPRARVSFNVVLDQVLAGPWLLSVEWNNALAVPRKGQKRQMAIFGYEFRLISPALYQVTLNPLTMTAVNMSDTTTVRAGGLIAKINSYGTIASIDHEALQFPEESDWPLSNLLTTSSWMRRQNLRVTNPRVEPDPSIDPVPVVTALSVVDKNSGTVKSYYNLGETVRLNGTVANGSNAQSYVWRFWDNSVETTTVAHIDKVVTPGAGTSYNGTVAMTVVDRIGNSSTKAATVPINHPPTVSLVVDQNVGIFPYHGSIVATVSDPDGDSVSLKWIENGTQIATGLTFDYLATKQTTLVARATDSRGGVTDSRVSFSGNQRQNPIVSPIIRSDLGRISVTNELDFSVYGLNPNTGGLLTFKWTFWNNSIPGLYRTGFTDAGLPLADNAKDFNYVVVANSVNPTLNGNSFRLAGSPGVVVTPSPGVDGSSPIRPAGSYDFQLSFVIPEGTDLGTVSLNVTGQAANYADIYVNDALALTHGFDFGITKTFSINPSNSTFVVGENTLVFRVINLSSAPSFLSVTAISGTFATTGVTTHVSNSNVYFNKAHKSLQGSTPGDKIVQVVVTDADGFTTTAQTTITLVQNTPPTIVSINTPASGALAGSNVPFGATVTDVDLDQVSYTWNFTSPRPLQLLGGNVKYPTVSGDVGSTIEGILTVDDGNGGITTAPVPVVAVASSFLKPITLSVAPGFYQSGFVQEITSQDTEVTIRYTLDGTDIFAETDGQAYLGPFIVSPPEGGVGNVVLKIRAFKDSYAPTDLLTATYTFYDPNSLNSANPAVGSGSSASNVAVVTIQSRGDTTITTASGANIPGDDGSLTVSPQSAVPEVSLADEASQPFAPLPPPGQTSTRNNAQTNFVFVKLTSPI
jgi:hypothetical protein